MSSSTLPWLVGSAGGARVLFVGDDWAEDHHDVEIQDETGLRTARAWLPEGVAGIARLHALLAEHLPDDADPAQVAVGIETDRGPWAVALIAAGYQVFTVNPTQVARYRERHSTSGAKSDTGVARTLADMVRTDRHRHRLVAGDSDTAEAVKILAWVHQTLIRDRQRQVLRLRAALRELFPAAITASTSCTPARHWNCPAGHPSRSEWRGCRVLLDRPAGAGDAD